MARRNRREVLTKRSSGRAPVLTVACRNGFAVPEIMAEVSKRKPQPVALHHLAWATGIIGLPLSHYWLVAKVEPFYSSIYCFLWWSYIFAVDFAVCRLRGTSLLRDRPKELLLLAIWSVPVWMFFEMVNLCIQNWYYVMVPWSFSWGLMFLVLAFGTVLPAIFETMELVVGLIEKLAPRGRIEGSPLTVSLWNVRIQWGIGALMLALLLAFPKSCYCLAWGFAFFLTEPICYWFRRTEKCQVGRSLLGQLASGDNTRLVALLASGLICGGLWEAWNVTARTKWIYSVPFFDELKLGEMPLLGFLGFPPFALECYALINFLSLLRRGRNWELTASENLARHGLPAWGVAASAVLLPIIILVCGVATAGISVGSVAAPMDYCFRRELGEAGINALRLRNVTEGHQFLQLQERPPEIDAELFARMRRIVALSECKGLGIWNARELEKLNITRLDELARGNPVEMARKLTELGGRVRVEEVKIWIREANRIEARNPSIVTRQISTRP
jgi:hypothetical protein